MKKLLTLVLAAALALSLVACGGVGTSSGNPSVTGEDTQASQTPEKEHIIPGTYEAVSLFSATAYVLHENGSFDSGEQKGTYTANDDGNRITIQPKDSSDSRTLTACGEYYHTETKMTKDTEYGLAPSFDDAGRSNQTFEAQADNVFLTLELNEDGSFVFSTSEDSPVSHYYKDVVTYEGSYTLEDTVLSLNWNGVVYPFLFADEVIYPVVYTKQTDANSGEIETAQNAIQIAEEEAAQNRWWTPAEEAEANEILAELAGFWEQKDTYSFYQLKFTDSDVWINMEIVGVPLDFAGSVTVLNRALILDYQYIKGNTIDYRQYVVPYTYTDGNLSIYEMIGVDHNDDKSKAILDPAVDFLTVVEGQFQKMS
ncbi:MAG: hypothetical protein ACOX81_09990 [Candidatus Heteroscillospira sp.]|jgi:hypothetical protein